MSSWRRADPRRGPACRSGIPPRPGTTSPRRGSPACVETDNTVSFHVSKIGTPVLVKVSYFPNWQASGATGPYRVTPNLMVVVPTAHDVVLHYGASPANRLGQGLTIIGVAALVHLGRAGPLQKRRGRAAERPDGRMTFRPPPKVVAS